MKKIFSIIISVFCFFYVHGQIDSGFKSKQGLIHLIRGDSISIFMDSLKIKILSDTLKFNPKDLVHVNGATENKKPYSSLIIINKKYFYRLDIINGTMVAEFAKEILRTSNVSNITLVKKPLSMEIFGPEADNGVVSIILKPGSKLNYKVAGLKYTKYRKGGDNFNQRKKGEIMIRS